ncbi:MAG: GNAT family N-acetyltransferase [Bacteroidota bacterium]
MASTFVLKRFEELSLDELYAIMRLRQEVFIVEQDCPYLDADGKDQASLHLMLLQDDNLAAYVRLLPEGISYDDYVSIGRVVSAIKYRRAGYGRRIMQEALKVAKAQWSPLPIKISAQVYLLNFYTALGFKAVGTSYMEDDIPHIAMIYSATITN